MLLSRVKASFCDIVGRSIKGPFDREAVPDIATQALEKPPEDRLKARGRWSPSYMQQSLAGRIPAEILMAGVAAMATPALGHQLGVAETVSVGFPLLTASPITDRKLPLVCVKPV